MAHLIYVNSIHLFSLKAIRIINYQIKRVVFIERKYWPANNIELKNDIGVSQNDQCPYFTKGLILSQVLGLNPVLKLRLFSQLSFVLKTYSQRVTKLSPRLSNNHSGVLCHVTFLFYSNYNIGDIYPSFNAFYLRKSAVLKWKTLLTNIKVPKTALVRCSV